MIIILIVLDINRIVSKLDHYILYLSKYCKASIFKI